MANNIASLLTPPVRGQDHKKGPAEADVTLVEYGDYECPFCGSAHQIVNEIEQIMGNRLRFVYRHFPLAQIHPHAELAAEAAEAAGAQGKFWEMHDLLFKNQRTLDQGSLLGLARAANLDLDRFDRELQGRVYQARVREDFLSGVRSGVNGTPTFYINGARHDGSWELEPLLRAIQLRAG
jgi:protein-disulfide isomerase